MNNKMQEILLEIELSALDHYLSVMEQTDKIKFVRNRLQKVASLANSKIDWAVAALFLEQEVAE